MKTLLLTAVVAVVFAGAFIKAIRDTNAAQHAHECLRNLADMDAAKTVLRKSGAYALSSTPTITQLRGSLAHTNGLQLCPDGGEYIVGTLFEPPRCTTHGHSGKKHLHRRPVSDTRHNF